MVSRHGILRWRRELAAIGCLAVAVALVLSAELAYRESSRRYQSAAESVSVSAKLHVLAARLTAAASGQRNFLRAGEWHYLDPYQDAVPAIHRLVEQLRPRYASHPDATASDVFTALTAAVGAKLGEIELTLELARRGRPDRAMEIVDSGIGRRTMEEIGYLLADLSQREDTAARNTAFGWQETLARWRLGFVVLALCNVLLAAALLCGARLKRRLVHDRERVVDQRVRARTQQLDSLASKLQEAAEAERAALARELHDELGALLTAAKMDVAWVKARLGSGFPALHPKLERVLHYLDQGVVAKRRIVEGLRPSTLASFGLATAVRELAEQIAERADWQLELQLPQWAPPLPQDIEIALFRVLQESLTNAAKYARARRVRVQLWYQTGSCRLEVQDDGCGFHAEAVPATAHGLLGMRQRMEAKGGEWRVRSAPGRGTSICASLPLAPVHAHERVHRKRGPHLPALVPSPPGT